MVACAFSSEPLDCGWLADIFIGLAFKSLNYILINSDRKQVALSIMASVGMP